MGLFNGFLGKKEKETKKAFPWILLDSVEQLNEVEKQSEQAVTVIFKHSTRCGTSRMALRSFEANYDVDTDEVKLYIVDVLNQRAVSDEIAARFQVFHQSPQLLFIKKGKTIAHFSHHEISTVDINEFTT